MQLSRYLYVPYQLARRPLAVIDRHAVSKLPTGNPIRTTYRDALGVADRVMALVLGESGPARARATPGRPAPDETPSRSEQTTSPADAAPSAADKQRRRAFAKKEEQVARANHSPAAMKRDLARMQAVVDAREHSESD